MTGRSLISPWGGAFMMKPKLRSKLVRYASLVLLMPVAACEAFGPGEEPPNPPLHQSMAAIPSAQESRLTGEAVITEAGDRILPWESGTAQELTPERAAGLACLAELSEITANWTSYADEDLEAYDDCLSQALAAPRNPISASSRGGSRPQWRPWEMPPARRSGTSV